jgi:hypothetical protein
MPRKPRQSHRSLAEQEERIQLAIQALKKGKIPSIRRAIEVFNIPYTTLRDRIQGHEFQAEHHNRLFQLSETQEEALVE